MNQKTEEMKGFVEEIMKEKFSSICPRELFMKRHLMIEEKKYSMRNAVTSLTRKEYCCMMNIECY